MTLPEQLARAVCEIGPPVGCPVFFWESPVPLRIPSGHRQDHRKAPPPGSPPGTTRATAGYHRAMKRETERTLLAMIVGALLAIGIMSGLYQLR